MTSADSMVALLILSFTSDGLRPACLVRTAASTALGPGNLGILEKKLKPLSENGSNFAINYSPISSYA